MPILKPFKSKSFSCTQLFLMQYSSKYITEISDAMRAVSIDGYMQAYYYTNWNEYGYFKGNPYIKCGQFFKKNISFCNKIERIMTDSDFHFYEFDWNILVKYNQILFSLFLNPIFGLICIGLNILTILILSNKHMTDKKEIYTNLKFNSIFILVFNFVSLFKLLYVCMNKSNWNDAQLFIDFCLFDIEIGIGRYINIILLKFLCNSFKTIANIYYALFVIDRFIKTTNTNNEKIKKISKISFKIKLFCIILFSIAVNLYTYFQYSNNVGQWEQYLRERYVFSNRRDFSFNSSILSHVNDLDDYSQDLKSSSLIVLKIFSLIRIIFSDFFFTIITFIFDILLFIFIKKSMNKKKEILDLVVSNVNATKKLKENKSTKKRMSKMIILNGLNFFIFRSPSLVLSFYGFIYRYDEKTNQHLPNVYDYIVCRTQHFCNILTEIAFSLYLISFIIQFFIFFKSDKNFKISYYNILRKKH